MAMQINQLNAAAEALATTFERYQAALTQIRDQSGDIPAQQWTVLVPMARQMAAQTEKVITEIGRAGNKANGILQQTCDLTTNEFQALAGRIDVAAKAFHSSWGVLRDGNAAYSLLIVGEGASVSDGARALTGADATAFRQLPELAALIAVLDTG